MESHGIPVAIATTKANAHDLQSALKTLDMLRLGGRCRRPKRLRADKGYDSIPFRKALRQRGIKPAINHREYQNRKQPAQQWNDSGEIRYGKCRWKVEQRFACLDQNRRLNFLYEAKRETYEGFMTLAMVKCYLRLLSKCRK